MKPYSERLPMIDKAIKWLDGKLPTAAHKRPGNYYVQYGVVKMLIDVYRVTEVDGKLTGHLCTVEEFEQRAKELGYNPRNPEILALRQEIDGLRSVIEELQNKVVILEDKAGEPINYKCVVYDLSDAETKLKETLIRMGWTPPKEHDDG